MIDGGTCRYTPHCMVHTGERRVPVDLRRGTRGPQYNTILNAHDVQLLRKWFDEGRPRQELVDYFGVSYTTIQDIGRRRTWKWLP